MRVASICTPHPHISSFDGSREGGNGGSFGAVFDAVSSPVQRRLHSFSQMHLQWLEKVVREGVERGQFRIGDQRPRDVAMQILAGVQGALLMGRLIGDPHVIDTVAVELRSYLGSARDVPTC